MKFLSIASYVIAAFGFVLGTIAMGEAPAGALAGAYAIGAYMLCWPFVLTGILFNRLAK